MHQQKSLFLKIATILLIIFATPSSIFAAEPPSPIYLNNFFKLYRFIPPEEVLLYENRDMTRKDIGQQIVSDTRTPPQGGSCVVGTDTCKGEVTLRNEVSPGFFEMQTLPDSGVCRPEVNISEVDGTKTKEGQGGSGYCDYRKKPGNSLEVTTVDFSKSEELMFPKLQNTFYKYWYDGGSNKIGYGSHNLAVPLNEQYVRKAIALAQAAETTDTVDVGGGEWPLGGVNYEAPLFPGSDISLIEAWRALEEDDDGRQLKIYAKDLISQWEEMLRPPVSPILDEKQLNQAKYFKTLKTQLTELVSKNLNKEPIPNWAKLFIQAPECAPGYDKGYIMASVCMLGKCSLHTKNDNIDAFVSNPSFRDQTIYSDPTIRQNLCSAIYDIYQKYPLEKAHDIIRKAAKKNPLLQYSLRTDMEALPKNVEKQLKVLDTALTRRENFTLPWFNKVIDGWRNGDEGYWYEKFGYIIHQGLEPKEAEAIEPIGFAGIILRTVNAIASEFIDSVFQALHHTVVIPPPAAHSIEALEQAIAETKDTSKQLQTANSASEMYSNYVLAEGDQKLMSGNRLASRTPQRYMSLYACTSQLFSSAWNSNVKDYVRGVRVGCLPETAGSDKLGMACKGQTIAASGACKICEEGVDSYLKNVGYPTLPKSLKEVIESAAQKYSVPGSLILGIMFAEGGFERSSQYGGPWTDENIKEYSSCDTEITNCRRSNVSSSGAVGPYQIIEKWYKDFLGDKGSACNFYDATEATAQALARGRYGYGATWVDNGATINGTFIPYNNPGTLPTSCGGWSQQDVVTSARAHRGVLDPNYFKMVLDFHRQYSCQ